MSFLLLLLFFPLLFPIWLLILGFFLWWDSEINGMQLKLQSILVSLFGAIHSLHMHPLIFFSASKWSGKIWSRFFFLIWYYPNPASRVLEFIVCGFCRGLWWWRSCCTCIWLGSIEVLGSRNHSQFSGKYLSHLPNTLMMVSLFCFTFWFFVT